MSYILDALKKAEADRDPESRASLAIAEHDRHRNRLLAYGMVVALIINAVVLLWLFFPTEWLQQTSAPGATEEAVGVSPESRIVRQPVEPPIPAAAPATTEPATVVEPTAVIQPTPVTRPPPRQASTTELTGKPRPDPGHTPATEPSSLASLPSDVRRRFPSLEFSTHIYADAPDLRAVVVNGVRLEEGDRLENLRVHEITEDGAIFAFEDRLVSVSVLDGWN